MSQTCCINGCKNKYPPASQIKFYRIPSGYRVFQSERRKLWIDAIQKANGSSNKLSQNSRICGDHFISGEASLDPDMPDYVPSVFPCSKQRPNTKRKRVEWIYRSRKRRRRPPNAGTESKSFSGQSSCEKIKYSAVVVLEKNCLAQEKTPPTPMVQEEVELQTEEILTETVSLQNTSNPNTVLPSLIDSAGTPVPQQMSPVVLLKSFLVPAGGFCCDLCDQILKDVSELINHHRQHHVQPPFPVTDEAPVTAEATGNREAPVTAEATGNREAPVTAEAMETSETPVTGEEMKNKEALAVEAPAVETPSVPTDAPSFPCNMCDRSFTTSQNLKRHKLLHVKDGRKCPKCGALFCRRHNHVVFQTRVEPLMKSEEDYSSEEEEEEEGEKEKEKEKEKEEEHLDHSSTAENNQPNKVKPNEVAEKNDNTQILPELQRSVPVICVLPLPLITQIVPKVPPVPSQIQTSETSAKAPGMPHPHSPSRLNNSTVPTLNPNSLPEVHPQLPPSLELFSPQRLTSSLLEVKRNYAYILSKPKIQQYAVEKKTDEAVCAFQSAKYVSKVKREKIAYDIEIIL